MQALQGMLRHWGLNSCRIRFWGNLIHTMHNPVASAGVHTGAHAQINLAAASREVRMSGSQEDKSLGKLGEFGNRECLIVCSI